MVSVGPFTVRPAEVRDLERVFELDNGSATPHSHATTSRRGSSITRWAFR